MKILGLSVRVHLYAHRRDDVHSDFVLLVTAVVEILSDQGPVDSADRLQQEDV